MKRWISLLAVLAIVIPLSLLAADITINQMPSKGVIPYIDNGDGTFTAQTATVAGSVAITNSGVGTDTDMKVTLDGEDISLANEGLGVDTAIKIQDGGNTITVDGTVSATLSDNSVRDTGMLADDIQVDSCTVNPYSDVTKALTGVKSLRIKARTGIDVRVAIGAATGNNYEVVFAGEPFVLKNLNAVDITIAAMGNDATAGDTGVVSIVYTK